MCHEPEPEPEMASFWKDFQFKFTHHEEEFCHQFINLETYVMYCVLFALVYAHSFVSTALLWGFGLHNLLLLVSPGIIFVWSIVLFRWWTCASPYIPHAMGLNVLLGFASQMVSLHFQVPLQARQTPIKMFRTSNEEVLQQAGQLASSQLLVPYLMFAIVLLHFSASFPYNRVNFVVHVALPLTLVLATIFSHNIYPQMCLSITFAAFLLFSMVLSIRRTLAHRKRFVLEVTSRQAKELEMVAQFMEVNQQAESILSHKLKNAMVDASTLIKSFLQNPSEVSEPLLSQASECLQTGLQWFGRRLVVLKCIAGQYTPQLEAVDLGNFVRSVLSGQDLQMNPIGNSCVLLDANLSALLVDTVVSNAKRHGHPRSPDICLRVDLHPVANADHDEDLHRRLVLSVTNRADPAKPTVSRELVMNALASKKPEFIGDFSGLQCIFWTADVLGMQVSFTQEGETVRFRGIMEIALVKDSQTSQKQIRVQAPRGLTVCCIDDSPVARGFVSSQIEMHFPDCTMQSFGEHIEDVQAFKTAALAGADIAILDQNLDYGRATVLGTTIVTELLAEGFQGFLCIRSANTSPADLDLYERAGAHLAIDKAVLANEMIRQIILEYSAFRRQKPWTTGCRTAQSSSIGTLERSAAPSEADSPSPKEPRCSQCSQDSMHSVPGHECLHMVRASRTFSATSPSALDLDRISALDRTLTAPYPPSCSFGNVLPASSRPLPKTSTQAPFLSPRCRPHTTAVLCLNDSFHIAAHMGNPRVESYCDLQEPSSPQDPQPATPIECRLPQSPSQSEMELHPFVNVPQKVSGPPLPSFASGPQQLIQPPRPKAASPWKPVMTSSWSTDSFGTSHANDEAKDSGIDSSSSAIPLFGAACSAFVSPSGGEPCSPTITNPLVIPCSNSV